MSYFDDASLVMIPSGYKTSKVYSVKPTDGSGDLTFSRSNDTATRVAANGLIEKVRTNLILQSNTFSTTWGNDDSTETSGQAGYDGTNNAWLLTKTAANGRISQVLSVSGSATFSVYAKAGTDSWLRLASSDAGVNAYFDLTNGTIGTTGAGTLAKITSVGNGWYRCSISGNASFTFFNIWVADADNDTSGTSGNILIQAAQLETGDIATDYIATTSAAVSVGPVANVPRLDYLNSSCPRLLLEPQRTNLLIDSEQINLWTSAGGSAVGNTVISPDGTQNADTLTGAVYQTPNVTGTFTYSLFAKKTSGNNFITLRFDTPTTQLATFNLNTGVVTFVASGYSATITPYANGWYRCTFTTPPSTNVINTVIYPESGGTLSTYVWGAQLEAGAYATSYIPTLGAAVTRGADNASKTSASAIIGQTEGTMFWEFERGAAGFDYFQLNGGSTSNWILLGIDGSNFLAFINNGGVNQVNILTALSSGVHKAAFAYKNNDCALYLDGVQIGTDTSASIPATSVIRLGGPDTSSAREITAYTNQAILFPTRLSNSDLAALTA